MEEDCTLGKHGLVIDGWEKAKNETVSKDGGKGPKSL